MSLLRVGVTRMHHTKFKADIGLAKVIADLVSRGWIPCIPLSEHQTFDLVAVSQKGKLVRVQAKYASLKENGVIDVKCRTSWADKNGNHERRYRTNDFDYYAIYCPEKDKVLYIRNTGHYPKTIRFERSGNNQRKHVRWADDYLIFEK